MLNFFKIALAILILNFINIRNVFAADYDVKGYITSVKANNLGPTCFTEVSLTPNGPTYQAGYWNCHNYNGVIMFELARTAKIQLFPVVVTFNSRGYPEDNMWVNAIEAK